MDQNITLNIENESLVFDCRRAIYWPRRKMLIAADLHWGKTHYLRNHGVAITDKVFEADLKRLSELMDDYETDTLMVLGDLIHHEKSLSKGLIDQVAHFREHNACELVLVKGNHDRYTEFPDSWGIVEEDDFYLPPFYFSHEYNPKKSGYQFSGHVHPMIRLKAGVDSLRLPSFILDDAFCLLPAFSHLTGGQDIRLQKNQKGIVLMPDGLEIFEK